MPKQADGAEGRRDTVWQDEKTARRYLDQAQGVRPLAAQQFEVALRVAAALGRPVRRFADLGCGDGIVAATLLERHPDAEGTLVDFSAAMLEGARRRFKDAGARVRIVQADLASPSWTGAVADRAPFDLVASRYAIHHLTDARKRALYGELFRLLQPGGLFLNIEHVASATPWVQAIHDDWQVGQLHQRRTEKDPAARREDVAREYLERPDRAANILALVEDQCAWLREIGYGDVDCFFKAFEYAVFGGRRPSASLSP